MVLLELFSGIGGFSKGLEAAGYTFDKVYFSEIDKHAIANFKYNFPYAEHIGTVTNIGEVGIERPHIVTFGSPCQNFSAIGDGKGLQGGESHLVRYAVEAVRRFRPDVFIWENVKGIFFARHRPDFGALSKRLPTLAVIDLNGNCVIRHGFYPKTGSGCTLSDVLQTDVPQTYFLSLRRAECMVRSGVMNPLLVQVVR
ncbi:DNA cytosine methyltransferase [Parabacteroides goldsteinii]|nr:DNA cytosine methyltransferase [Parabacteroides goldsteinii]MDZ3928357.1 DNA cytosine methyltransferase [Parabacteroides goldsteinii]